MGKEKPEAEEPGAVYSDVKGGTYTILPSRRSNMATVRPRTEEFTDIYLDRKTGTYFVQPYVMGPISWTHFGEPSVVTPQQFEYSITPAILEALDRFNKEVFDESLANKADGELKYEPFAKKMRSVNVTRLDSGALIIRPLHHKGGGYVGRDEDAVILQAEEVHAKLADTIRHTFKRAT